MIIRETAEEQFEGGLINSTPGVTAIDRELAANEAAKRQVAKMQRSSDRSAGRAKLAGKPIPDIYEALNKSDELEAIGRGLTQLRVVAYADGLLKLIEDDKRKAADATAEAETHRAQFKAITAGKVTIEPGPRQSAIHVRNDALDLAEANDKRWGSIAGTHLQSAFNRQRTLEKYRRDHASLFAEIANEGP